MRAVIDTNIWVSALINAAGWPARILQALRDRRFTAVTSSSMITELAAVLSRPRFSVRYGVDASDTAKLIALLTADEIVETSGVVKVCRDPADDMVIETAINGRADVIVSRDDDVKRDPRVTTFLAPYGIEALSVRQFLERLER